MKANCFSNVNICQLSKMYNIINNTLNLTEASELSQSDDCFMKT